MTAGDPALFFDAIAGRYERIYALPAPESRRRMQTVLGELPAAPARILDLGVGTGREVAPLLDAGHVPTGVDVSGAMLERCARRARPIPLVHADFWRSLPFPDGSFDAAIALHGTLAHAPDDDAMSTLSGELARLLRPGGICVFEVPSLFWLDRLEEGPPDLGDRTGRRTGPRSFFFEDRIARAGIAGRVLSDGEWVTALGAAWRTRVRPLGELERLVVATRE